MYNPFSLPPHPAAQEAAAEVIDKVHAYMRTHPKSELHQCGKMFGVLVYDEMSASLNGDASRNGGHYLAAFSAMLDGSYNHEGFVPPVLTSERMNELTNEGMPVGHSKKESQRLQRLLFAQYNLRNGKGESKNLLEIFASEKPILSKEEFFGKSSIINHPSSIGEAMPPSGAGECCAPKLLQYALTHGLKPIALAEFWIGAPSKTEIRHEGAFYAPCSGKCVPILRHMLQGIEVEQTQEARQAAALCRQIEVLYEDEWLMVVNKPSGLLSVPGKSDELAVESYFRHKAVHRLDQDTSGLLVLAKTEEVYKTLQAYFQRRDILKRYEAVVYGLTNERLNELTSGTISLPLLPNPFDRPRQMVDKEHGKQATTRFAVRERRADGTVLMDLFPLTGRTHQLRVHAAHPEGLNAPIVGDRLYGMSAAKPLNDAMSASRNSERLLLHAAEIGFVHPITKEEMHFCIPSHF